MKSILLITICLYQKFLSAVFNTVALVPSRCRFIPSCSEYTYQAVERFGLIKGFFWGMKRLLHCHPF